jgi:predicted AAA+ superfamily ATPase
MKRYLFDPIKIDLTRKMVILIGPRQIGKTFLAKQLVTGFQRPQYLNTDAVKDRQVFQAQSWPLNTDFLVFDEIHKIKGWKASLKGIFDTRPDIQSILVTGSARLETFRQSGESLAGRYFHYHFYPLSVRELKDQMAPYDALDMLNRFGGFPEPFLTGSETEASRWRYQYYTDLVREDILEFSRIQEIRSIRLLLELLRDRVGSPLSYTSLAVDLQLSPNTVRKYVEILESLYIIFLIRPFHRNIARSLLKEPKVYFYDTGFVRGDDGVCLENTIAVSLLKHVGYLQDTKGEVASLHYLRTKEGKEVDFAICKDNTILQLIEVKYADDTISKNLRYFLEKLPDAEAIQLVHHLRHEQVIQKISLLSASQWLAGLSA